MIAAEHGHLLVWLIVGVSIALMLIRPRNIPEVYWISAGVLLLLSLRLVPLRQAAQAAVKALDVCLFLVGMMLLSELAREHGIFDWISSVSVRSADGSCTKLFGLVYTAGAVVTIFMSNDATAVVLTPAILTAVRKAKVEPLPYLFVCAFIANAASFVLPISNPANLVVFHAHMPTLPHWLLAFTVPSLLSIAATFVILRYLFRKQLCNSITCETGAVELSANGKFILLGLAIIVVVLLVASSFGKDLGLPTCLAAVIMTAIISVNERTNPSRLAREISWETLALVAGLFILVDAVEGIGATRYTQKWLLWAASFGQWLGTLATGFAVGIANNLVNNLPLGLLAGIAVQATQPKGLIANAILIGVDLGPNLSITGSLATILWLIALRKEKLDVTLLDFLKVGIFAMPIALLLSLCGAILMQILFHVI